MHVFPWYPFLVASVFASLIPQCAAFVDSFDMAFSLLLYLLGQSEITIVLFDETSAQALRRGRRRVIGLACDDKCRSDGDAASDMEALQNVTETRRTLC
jgi:hypothetical protein